MQTLERASIGLVSLLFAASCTPRYQRSVDTPTPRSSSAEHVGFVVRLGTDTIMLERFSSSNGVLVGDILDRSPTTSVMHYQLALDSIGNVRQLEAAQRLATSPAPLFAITARRVHEGFDVTVREGDSSHRQFVAAPAEAIPVFTRSVGLYEIFTRRFRLHEADSVNIPVLVFDSLHATERTLRRLGTDSVVIPLIFPRGEHARVDASGRILAINGMATSYKWMTERVPDVDIAAHARAFADRDAMGDSLGAYSSRDTVRAMIAGARLSIDYGRPRKRGRLIFGGLVPWGQVWRTGADLATHLTTDRNLRIGEVTLIAGTYTLYTVPSPTQWMLVVNTRTGQSGLFYDHNADVGRVEMMTTSLPTALERLTISVEQIDAARGRLTIAWDRLMAAVAFTVVPLAPAGVDRR